MLALALKHKWACKASMQEVYRRFGRPPTDLVHDHFTHCLKSWCLCRSCCSARWFAKGLTNLLVSNVCYIVSWIRTDSKMHQNCTQLILMVRSYPKKKTTTMNVNQYLLLLELKKQILKKCASSYLPELPLLTCSVISRLSGNWMNEFNFFLYPVFLYTKNNTDE